MERRREGSNISGSVHRGSYGEREGRRIYTYQGPSIDNPMERGGVCKYQGPYIGDPMEREGGLHISGSIY